MLRRDSIFIYLQYISACRGKFVKVLSFNVAKVTPEKDLFNKIIEWMSKIPEYPVRKHGDERVGTI
jgi:hypothetical protein